MPHELHIEADVRAWTRHQLHTLRESARMLLPTLEWSVEAWVRFVAVAELSEYVKRKYPVQPGNARNDALGPERRRWIAEEACTWAGNWQDVAHRRKPS